MRSADKSRRYNKYGYTVEQRNRCSWRIRNLSDHGFRKYLSTEQHKHQPDKHQPDDHQPDDHQPERDNLGKRYARKTERALPRAIPATTITLARKSNVAAMSLAGPRRAWDDPHGEAQ